MPPARNVTRGYRRHVCARAPARLGATKSLRPRTPEVKQLVQIGNAVHGLRVRSDADGVARAGLSPPFVVRDLRLRDQTHSGCCSDTPTVSRFLPLSSVCDARLSICGGGALHVVGENQTRTRILGLGLGLGLRLGLGFGLGLGLGFGFGFGFGFGLGSGTQELRNSGSGVRGRAPRRCRSARRRSTRRRPMSHRS
jgi:hypothetical protein